jgi:hypothetical protein
VTVIPNDFPCIEDYLSKLKTLGILCKDYKIDLEDDRFIYVILSKIGSSYCVFISIFYASRESLWRAHQNPTLESFCDSLIREKNSLQFGVINTIGTYKKKLVT